jgi:hypothetical protein
VGQIFSAPLDSTHAAAFVRFPVSSPIGIAGWYYCTMASLATGVCFNNTYSSGSNPTIPASPTAFSGLTPGTYAAVINTSVSGAPLVLIAAGSMGVNGILETTYTQINNNSAGTKLVWPIYSSVVIEVGQTTATNTVFRGSTVNQAAANAQVGSFVENGTVQPPVYGTANTANAIDYDFAFNNAVATDWIMLLSHSVKEYSH